DQPRSAAAVEGEREDHVEHGDGHEGGADGAPGGDTDAHRSAGGVVAVVAVDQRHDDGEHDHLDEGEQHVDRWEQQVEVVLVDAEGKAVELGGYQLGPQVAGEQGRQVQRHHRDHGRPDPG